jgi:hypothetical protein
MNAPDKERDTRLSRNARGRDGAVQAAFTAVTAANKIAFLLPGLGLNNVLNLWQNPHLAMLRRQGWHQSA